MGQLLTVSRAARLAGVSRGAIQQKIKSGELPTFEGMVKPADLLLAYPATELENNTILERVRHIKDNAFAKRVRDRVLPDAEVLAARLHELGRELVSTKLQRDQYNKLMQSLFDKLLDSSQSRDTSSAKLAESLQAWLVAELEKISQVSLAPQPLMIRDSLLKVMTAHVHLLHSGNDFFVEGSESILDAALSSGLALAYGCSDISCGLCKAKIVSGQVKTIHPEQYLLSADERNQGYALMCSCTAITDVVIEAEEASSIVDIPSQELTALVKAIRHVGDDLVILDLQTPKSNRLRFMAGQSIKLLLSNGMKAEAPIASCPCEDRHLQFHIPKRMGDDFSEFIVEQLKTGDKLLLQGPSGDFVLRDESSNRHLFIAFGEGFAPVKSLIEHTMALDVAESVQLFWYAASDKGHYLQNLCRAWADALDNFSFQAQVLAPDAQIDFTPIQQNYPELHEIEAYVAGPASFVRTVQSWLLAQGLPAVQFSGHNTTQTLG